MTSIAADQHTGSEEEGRELLCSKCPLVETTVTAPMLLPVQLLFPDRVLLFTVFSTFTAKTVSGVVIGENISVLQRRGELFYYFFYV